MRDAIERALLVGGIGVAVFGLGWWASGPPTQARASGASVAYAEPAGGRLMLVGTEPGATGQPSPQPAAPAPTSDYVRGFADGYRARDATIRRFQQQRRAGRQGRSADRPAAAEPWRARPAQRYVRPYWRDGYDPRQYGGWDDRLYRTPRPDGGWGAMPPPWWRDSQRQPWRPAWRPERPWSNERGAVRAAAAPSPG